MALVPDAVPPHDQARLVLDVFFSTGHSPLPDGSTFRSLELATQLVLQFRSIPATEFTLFRDTIVNLMAIITPDLSICHVFGCQGGGLALSSQSRPAVYSHQFGGLVERS